MRNTHTNEFRQRNASAYCVCKPASNFASNDFGYPSMSDFSIAHCWACNTDCFIIVLPHKRKTQHVEHLCHADCRECLQHRRLNFRRILCRATISQCGHYVVQRKIEVASGCSVQPASLQKSGPAWVSKHGRAGFARVRSSNRNKCK